MPDTQNYPIDKSIDKRAFVNIIETYVPLVKDKAVFRGYCPLCHNNVHSYQGFTLHPDELEWVCESCGERGGISDFFRKLRHIPAEEAARFAEMLASNQKFNTPTAAGLAHRPRFQTVSEAYIRPAVSAAAATVNAYAGKSLLPDNPPPTLELSDSQAPVIADTGPAAIVRETTTISEQLEAMEESVDDLPIADTLQSFSSGLLDMFDGRHGFRGIAVCSRDDEQLLGSTLKDLMQKDIEIINEYMKSILPEIKKVLGDYELECPSNTALTMGIRLNSEDLKLVWIPMAHKDYTCDVLLLLEQNAVWGMYLRQLDAYCTKHNKERKRKSGCR